MKRAGSLAAVSVVSLLAAGCASTAGPPVGNTRAVSSSSFGHYGYDGKSAPAGAQCGQRAGLHGSNGYQR